MSEHQWAGDPSTSSLTRRLQSARRAVLRALVAHGANPREGPVGGWDVTNLPLGGRVKITTAMHTEKRAKVATWVRAHAERRHWGALAWLAIGGRWGARAEVYVQMQLDDFAVLMGRLTMLERERERWLDGAPHAVDAGDGGR